jgi:hypothetical protein
MHEIKESKEQNFKSFTCILIFRNRYVLLFWGTVLFVYRFMTYPYFQRTSRKPGPASRTLYETCYPLPDPEMICRAGLRIEFSRAVSHLYFLKPHALILSHIEAKPLSDYFSREAYDRAQLLYFGGSSPGQDLANCMSIVRNQRF